MSIIEQAGTIPPGWQDGAAGVDDVHGSMLSQEQKQLMVAGAMLWVGAMTAVNPVVGFGVALGLETTALVVSSPKK